ncbi:MAG: glucose-6-phosphate isomerase [Candidatus Cloacimonadia bacterium]
MKNISYDYGNLLRSDKIQNGITNSDFVDLSQEVAEVHLRIQQDQQLETVGFFSLPDRNVDHLIAAAKTLRERFETLVVIGIGGSALGNKALFSALLNSKNLDREVIVLDNVDPNMLHQVLSSIDLENTLFNIITKSGTTTETMALYLIILDVLKKNFPDTYKEHVVITTDPEKGFLREIIRKEKYLGFDVPDNVGGRFSVLSDVGLLSSAFAGIDIKELLRGAAAMRKRCNNDDISKNPAYLNGLNHYIYYKKGYRVSVMMPYSNDLYDLADWYRQLWAESLGKKIDDDGDFVFTGQIPVKAIGATDQHSQLQLYMEGPNDKIITFLEVEDFDNDYVIPDLFPKINEFAYLANKTLSHLLNTEKIATELALYEAGRPNCTIKFPALNEYNIGEFIFMYQVQTLFTGYLMNIDPLNQPGVEDGKKNTMALMGREGFEQMAEQVRLKIADKDKQGAKI